MGEHHDDVIDRSSHHDVTGRNSYYNVIGGSSRHDVIARASSHDVIGGVTSFTWPQFALDGVGLRHEKGLKGSPPARAENLVAQMWKGGLGRSISGLVLTTGFANIAVKDGAGTGPRAAVPSGTGIT